jgi:hypothetical protein
MDLSFTIAGKKIAFSPSTRASPPRPKISVGVVLLPADMYFIS